MSFYFHDSLYFASICRLVDPEFLCLEMKTFVSLLEQDCTEDEQYCDEQRKAYNGLWENWNESNPDWLHFLIISFWQSLWLFIFYINQLLYGFRVWMAWSKHAGKLQKLRKARETRAEGEWFCTLFLTRATFPIVWIRPS